MEPPSLLSLSPLKSDEISFKKKDPAHEVPSSRDRRNVNDSASFSGNDTLTPERSRSGFRSNRSMSMLSIPSNPTSMSQSISRYSLDDFQDSDPKIIVSPGLVTLRFPSNLDENVSNISLRIGSPQEGFLRYCWESKELRKKGGKCIPKVFAINEDIFLTNKHLEINKNYFIKVKLLTESGWQPSRCLGPFVLQPPTPGHDPLPPFRPICILCEDDSNLKIDTDEHGNFYLFVNFQLLFERINVYLCNETDFVCFGKNPRNLKNKLKCRLFSIKENTLETTRPKLINLLKRIQFPSGLYISGPTLDFVGIYSLDFNFPAVPTYQHTHHESITLQPFCTKKGVFRWILAKEGEVKARSGRLAHVPWLHEFQWEHFEEGIGFSTEKDKLSPIIITRHEEEDESPDKNQQCITM